MLFSIFCAFAVGLAATAVVATVVVPLVLGLFDRRDTP